MQNQDQSLTRHDALTFAFATAGDAMVAAQIRARLAARKPAEDRRLTLAARVVAYFARA